MKIPRIRYVPDKHDLLRRLALGRRVLHVGCADALADVDMKLDRGRFLHARLAETSLELWGCDVDQAGLERLRSLGFTRLVVADAQDLKPEDFEASPFDLVVAAEVIEHLTNPGGLIETARRILAPTGQLCITTPNGALSLKTFLHSLRGVEEVAPEHVVLLSFTSMNTMFDRFGYQQPKWFTALERQTSLRNKIANRLLEPLVRWLPQYGDSLIAVTRMK